MKKTLLLAVTTALLLALAGCQSVTDIDVSSKSAPCAVQCQSDHGQCMSGPTMAPIDRNNLCVNAMRACIRACPAKGAVDLGISNQGDVYTQLKQLQELKNSGIITQEEFDARKKRVLAQ